MGPTPDADARLTIELWADVLCPWCYLGEQRLDAAIAASGHADRIDVVPRTFQLDPDAPAIVTSTLSYLAKKFGVSEAQAREMEEGMAERARADGLGYTPDRPAGNTLDMLRVVHLARGHGLGWEYLRAIQVELFEGNPDSFEHATLRRVAAEVGVPAAEVDVVLASDRFADAVRAEHREAIELGANGVPFTVFGRRIGVRGAVGTDAFAAAIDEAWRQAHTDD